MPRLDDQWVYVDVDKTLGPAVVGYCRTLKARGARLVLWSARGELHARHVADQQGVIQLFDFIAGKPTVLIDDQGWRWTRLVQTITNRNQLKARRPECTRGKSSSSSS